MIDYEERVFFTPGDIVKNNKLKDAPEMYVIRKKEITIHEGNNK